MSEREVYYSIFNTEDQKRLEQDTRRDLLQKLSTTLQDVQIVKTIFEIMITGIKTGNLVESDQDRMSILYGDYARPLGDKSEFPGLLRRLGYAAPDSMVISSTSSPTDRLANVLSYYTSDKGIQHIFCKPLNGIRQRDLHDFDIQAPEFQQYITSVPEDTLVQEFMSHEHVLRYTRYKDKARNSFVSCYGYENERKSKHIPVIGSRKIPGSKATVDKLYADLRHKTSVPLANEHSELDNVNKFMNGVISNLETNLGGNLPFFSCDIGVRDMEQLQGEYNDERMHSNLIFFESQAIPGPPRGEKNEMGEHPLKGYLNLLKHFLQEHRTEILPRIREVKERSKQNFDNADSVNSQEQL